MYSHTHTRMHARIHTMHTQTISKCKSQIQQCAMMGELAQDFALLRDESLGYEVKLGLSGLGLIVNFALIITGRSLGEWRHSQKRRHNARWSRDLG